MTERVEAAWRGVGFAGKSAHQQAVVEGGADHAGRVSRHAVERVEATRSQERSGIGQLSTAGRAADREGIDVREGGQLVDERVTGEERALPQLREVGPGPPAWNEIASGIGVAASFAADGEVEERAGLRRRLAHMAAPAGPGLPGRGFATEFRKMPRGRDRVVKELFAKVALRFCDLEEGIGSSIGEPRLRQVA